MKCKYPSISRMNVFVKNVSAINVIANEHRFGNGETDWNTLYLILDKVFLTKWGTIAILSFGRLATWSNNDCIGIYKQVFDWLWMHPGDKKTRSWVVHSTIVAITAKMNVPKCTYIIVMYQCSISVARGIATTRKYGGLQMRWSRQ